MPSLGRHCAGLVNGWCFCASVSLTLDCVVQGAQCRVDSSFLCTVVHCTDWPNYMAAEVYVCMLWVGWSGSRCWCRKGKGWWRRREHVVQYKMIPWQTVNNREHYLIIGEERKGEMTAACSRPVRQFGPPSDPWCSCLHPPVQPVAKTQRNKEGSGKPKQIALLSPPLLLPRESFFP